MRKKKITFIVPVCSRGRHWKTIDDTPIIKTCLRTIKNTLTKSDYEKYKFEIRFGADADDPYFSNHANVSDIMGRIVGNGILASFESYTDTKHNPVQAWNHLARNSVEDGAEYLYQTGDDVEMLTVGWVDKFITALESTGNVGVAAPLDLGYHGLYTQSFVHKTHLEIMGSYFPPAFTNWYCDNATTDMYQPGYNHYFKKYHIKNTGGPQRYQANDSQRILPEEVSNCIIKLVKYMESKDPNFDSIKYLKLAKEHVMVRYEEISKTMTTAIAKPFWASAVNIFTAACESAGYKII